MQREANPLRSASEPAVGAISDFIALLQTAYPHGHPSFIKNVLKDVATHSSKNKDYAEGGRPLGNFERVASILSNYPGLPLNHPAVIAILYAFKQIDAVLDSLAKERTLEVDNIDERLKDVVVYFGIARCILEDRGESGDSVGGPG